MTGCMLKGVTNFVIYKFGHLVTSEWQTMYDLAKMFLHCLNHWKLDTPTARKQQQQGQSDDLALYRVNYTRYITIIIAFILHPCIETHWKQLFFRMIVLQYVDHVLLHVLFGQPLACFSDCTVCKFWPSCNIDVNI